MGACVLACVGVFLFVYAFACVSVSVWACTFVCVCVRAYVCVCVCLRGVSAGGQNKEQIRRNLLFFENLIVHKRYKRKTKKAVFNFEMIATVVDYKKYHTVVIALSNLS